MNRPVIIIDPLSSGVELAPTFKKWGIPSIAVTIGSIERIGYGTQIQTSDFTEIIMDQPNLVDILREYNPLAILPGTDKAVPLAEHLASILTPEFANDPGKVLNRKHKALMQKTLHESGVPCLKTINTSCENEVLDWVKENDLEESSLICKPPLSAGSDKVFHIPAKGDWKKAFNRILTEPSKITGVVSDTVVVQEEAIGTEYAVGTVSANGKHYLAHLVKYNKMWFNDRKTVIDYVEFVPYDEEMYGELFEYTKNCLDAMGIRWGAAHNEIMLTEKGPRLIETAARMCGGPSVNYTRQATGSSQADKLVEALVNGDVMTKEYTLKTPMMSVFLKSPVNGVVSNSEVLTEISQLPTLFNKHIWFKNGDMVPKTEDFLTSIGMVALCGDRDSILSDYEKIRNMESELVISEVD
ncbi:ATP-grasp domain-containing protein [Chryseobacterium potabilaquae]|uniref:Dapdiamide A synthase n=1 Tax=Chryseobacterium potabilaquae TaxID=2675057 RepID=A0A6N4WYW9_9FLAO|nr:ATP-grasp domain-containing protein [Chryseobacterium potabilaquae]CAA7193654.1 Dapdiamide A synthase [Chryseobacterium potabilaquae]